MSSFWTLAHDHTDLSQNWCWLPGWSFTADVFRPFWEVLPGQHWIANYQNTARSLDQACALAAAAPAKAIWVGWSLGGAIATLAAAKANAAALVTLATGRRFLADAAQGDLANNDHSGMSAEDFDAFCNGFEANPEKTLKRFLSLCAQGADDPRTLMKTLKACQLDAEPALRDTLGWLTQYDLTAPALPGVHCYGQTDALQAQGLEPTVISPAGSHAFFLTADGQQALLRWLQPLLLSTGGLDGTA